MSKQIENNILIIGGPHAGKTHFGGQLYGRLNSRKFKYKIDQNHRPADLTIFEDVLNKLAEGKRAGHTEASANRSIELKIENESGEKIVFAFPDYAGEQVKMIVDNRRVNPIWKDYIAKSTSWMLFVRIDELKTIEDIINRGIPNPAEITKRKATPPPVKISDSAHFVELLQTLLYIKGIATLSKVKKPNLTILLSCWDIPGFNENTIPSDELKLRLPLLYEYVKNTWDENSFSVLGLSSTEKTLTDEPDEAYNEGNPTDFGYIINKIGKKEKDLTLSIAEFIGKD